MYANSKIQTQFSRKLQRFRGCRKNKKCSIFHELSEYQQKWQLFSHWSGPLMQRRIKMLLGIPTILKKSQNGSHSIIVIGPMMDIRLPEMALLHQITQN